VVHVDLDHVAQLLEGLVDVADPEAFAGVVGHPPVLFSLLALVGGEVVVVFVRPDAAIDDVRMETRAKRKNRAKCRISTFIILTKSKEVGDLTQGSTNSEPRPKFGQRGHPAWVAK